MHYIIIAIARELVRCFTLAKVLRVYIGIVLVSGDSEYSLQFLCVLAAEVLHLDRLCHYNLATYSAQIFQYSAMLHLWSFSY